MKQVFATLICALCIVQSSFAAETGGEKFGGVVINNDWTFAMGNAASKELDYTMVQNTLRISARRSPPITVMLR